MCREGDTVFRSKVMESVKFNCDCDLVIEMEEMGIKAEEILQYVKGVFSRDEQLVLISRLKEIASTNGEE